MSKRKPTPKWDQMPMVHPNAAGLDIGAAEIWACVPSARDPEPVRCFATFTPDLHRLADWLVACGVDTVAMESTGVYWIPMYDILEARGLKVFLVNSQHLKRVPGRKSDVLDCQWLQKLHTLGLLAGSFRPDAEMVAVRTLLRHRAMLLEHRAPHILHMQKALQHMNLLLHQVLSDVTGETGLQIIRAIVAGQRDPVRLARLRSPNCKSSADEIAKALTGNYAPEHLFTLTQALALFDFYTQQVAACDAELERRYAAMKPRWDGPDELPQVPPVKKDSHSKNQPAFNVRAHLLRLTGVDLVGVMGLSASTVQTILSEIGTDMSKWPNEKHFGSWLGLAPHHEISGGKILRNNTLKVNNRAAQAFRQAAQSVARSHSALGAYYRRQRARLGEAQAIVATAHKIARIVYHLLKHREAFIAESAADYEARLQQRELAQLKRKAAKLGLSLVPARQAALAT
jgi:transposase